jgi:plastocyanin
VFDSKNEVIAWAVAIVGVAIMGLLVWGAANNQGPFHKVNNAKAKSAFAPVHVKINTNTRTIGDYTPASVTVHPGQDVIFTNVSNNVHTVTARKDNSFDSKDINTGGGHWTLVAPAKPGDYPYYCVYHPLMFGKVIVKG